MPMIRMARWLEKQGIRNILFLRPDSARKVNTTKRREIIEYLKINKVSSIRDLARKLNRTENAVHKDLQVLNHLGIVAFEKEDNRLIPKLRHENIFVKPISLAVEKEKLLVA